MAIRPEDHTDYDKSSDISINELRQQVKLYLQVNRNVLKELQG